MKGHFSASYEDSGLLSTLVGFCSCVPRAGGFAAPVDRKKHAELRLLPRSGPALCYSELKGENKVRSQRSGIL